jgi:hypothetical protein
VLFLHALNVDCHSILACELNRHGKVIDLLIGIQPLVKVIFTLRVRPQHIPVMPVSLHQPVEFK